VVSARVRIAKLLKEVVMVVSRFGGLSVRYSHRAYLPNDIGKRSGEKYAGSDPRTPPLGPVAACR
jgi:hypothetical protein